MFAIVETGGKQYNMQAGKYYKIEKIEGEVGNKITFDQILFISNGDENKIGLPIIEGAKVIAEIYEQIKDEKTIIFKKKKRQNYRRKKGHRQRVTIVKILEIVA
jgi:large subunit ribosomal protein L21